MKTNLKLGANKTIGESCRIRRTCISRLEASRVAVVVPSDALLSRRLTISCHSSVTMNHLPKSKSPASAGRASSSLAHLTSFSTPNRRMRKWANSPASSRKRASFASAAHIEEMDKLSNTTMDDRVSLLSIIRERDAHRTEKRKS